MRSKKPLGPALGSDAALRRPLKVHTFLSIRLGATNYTAVAAVYDRRLQRQGNLPHPRCRQRRRREFAPHRMSASPILRILSDNF
jgi:hypothetical protein